MAEAGGAPAAVEASGALEVLALDDAGWERVVEATGGTAALCYQCGVCTATCPWGLVLEEAVSVRRLVRRAQLGAGAWGPELWRCTTCGACEARCPRGVDVSLVMMALRREAWRGRAVPHRLSGVLWDLHFDGNPWGRPPSQRSAWARGLEVPRFSSDHEILYYVGCTAAYDRRAQKVARALVALFRAAGVAFGTLGDDEPCCGHSARDLGQLDYAREVQRRGRRRFEEAGVATAVTTSPHCFDMFRSGAEERGAGAGGAEGNGWRPVHYTEYLAGLVDAGRLEFPRSVDLRVTYHDPCYLGRKHGVYDEPRRLLAAIRGVELVEMERTREDALCCGGGGGRMWLETQAGERFSDLRVREAAATGAQVLATACPHCITCLEDSIKVAGLKGIQVLDVAELALLALGGDAP